MWGNKMTEETSFDRLKKVMLIMLKGYPEFEYYGKVEYFFTKNGDAILDILKDDKLIELRVVVDGQKRYRLTPAGINLATSMINSDNSEKVLDYTNKTNIFTAKIKSYTLILILIALGQFSIIWLQLLTSG